MSKARILAIDIETAPNLVYTWGLFNQNIALNQIVKASYMLSYAAQWVGEKGMIFDSVHQSTPAKMMKGLHKLLESADIVLHYNGTRFDMPTINKEFIKLGLLPPSSYKHVDLLKTARNKFKFTSNKLEFVSGELGIGSKVSHEGFPLWVKCMNGDEKAWKSMEKYNRHDVTLLITLYNKLLPWINNHPVVGDTGKTCPKCDSTEVTKDGTKVDSKGKFQKYRCKGCGTILKGDYVTKIKQKYKYDN
jgi:DNA polymerase elongation subunit (family B)